MRKRMTAHQPPQSHQPSPCRAIPFHSLHRIFRAGRNVAACRRKHRRDSPLVPSQQLQSGALGNLAHRIQSRALRLGEFRSNPAADLSPILPASFCSITRKARLTSFTTSAKSAVNSDFFGLITTSALAPASGRVSRTASRKRRFIRLRSTAPPSPRPTVNPMRSPEATEDLAASVAWPGSCRCR
jgi:hypothetical protein